MSETNGNDVFITLVCGNDCNHETVEQKIDENELIKELKKEKEKLFDLGIFVNEKGVAISTTFLKKKLQEKKEILQIVGEIYDIMDNTHVILDKNNQNKVNVNSGRDVGAAAEAEEEEDPQQTS